MLTIWDWFDRDTPMKERYQLISEAGFDGVLMWWSNEFGRDKFGTDDYLNAPEIARNAGLTIENIHAPVQYANMLWHDNFDGQGITECYLQCIRDCKSFEIPTMVLHLPNEQNPYSKLGIDRFKNITELAEQNSINVALENLHNLSNLDFILRQIDSNRVGFCYDSGHHYRYYPEFDMLSKYGERLMALHLHDNNGSHGQHGLPFDGNIDWNEVMRNIVATGYIGNTALEPMKWDYEDFSVVEFLDLAYKKARRLDLIRI